MDTEELKRLIAVNAAEIVRLHARVHETARRRGDGAQARGDWDTACAEFHARYRHLAFPGGYDGALERIVAGDATSVEAAMCFLELRPYFFRSGYMYKELLRKIKRAPLSPDQERRLRLVLERQAAWRAQRVNPTGRSWPISGLLR